MGAAAAAGQRARRATQNLGSRAQAGADQLRHREIVRLHHQLRDLTMVPRRAFVDNVLLTRRGAAAGGDLVECGTWRGGLGAAMAWARPGRHSVLFDSFEGLPDAQPIDGPDAVRCSAQERGYDNCRAEEAWAAQAMAGRPARRRDHQGLVLRPGPARLALVSLVRPAAPGPNIWSYQ